MSSSSTGIQDPWTVDCPTARIVPALESGDRLARDEFERRYAAMPYVKKAELIEGVVFMPSPVRINAHARPHADLIGWLAAYRAGVPDVTVGDNATVRLDPDNEPQPDAVLFYVSPDRRRVLVSDDGYLEGPPELVAEVAASSVSIDLHAKFQTYLQHEVNEYVVWRVEEQEIDWFILDEGAYARLQPDTKGLFRSRAFPGLWLDGPAMLRGDLAQVLRVLNRGITARSK